MKIAIGNARCDQFNNSECHRRVTRTGVTPSNMIVVSHVIFREVVVNGRPKLKVRREFSWASS